MTEPVLDVAAGDAFKLVAKPLATMGVKGVKTTWTLTPKSTNVAAKYVPEKARAALKAASVAGAGDGWTNTVTLPSVGAEVFTLEVTVAGKGGVVVKRADLATGRRVPLTVYYTSAAAKAAWDAARPAFKAAFAPVGVELVESTPVRTDVATVEIARGIDTPRSIREGAAKLFTGGRLPAVTPPKGHLRIFAVDQLAILKDAEFLFPLSQNDVSSHLDTGIILTVLPRGTLAQRPIISAKLVYGAAAVAAAEAGDARWARLGRKTVDIAPVATRHADRKVKLALPDSTLDHFPDDGGDQKAAVAHIVFEHEERGFSGWSNGKDIVFVATQKVDGSALSPQVVARIAAHEVAHAFGQVAPARRLYPRGSEPNGKHYEGMGGEGHHCATATSNPTGSSRGWDGGAAGMCIMYHDTTAEHVNAAFCADCTLNLKLADLRLEGVRSTWGT